MRAGRALTTYSFLETPVPSIYQNVNSVYGYVRMRVNATTLITEVTSHVHIQISVKREYYAFCPRLLA